MKKNNLINVLKKIYKLLDTKQKLRFILIILIISSLIKIEISYRLILLFAKYF